MKRFQMTTCLMAWVCATSFLLAADNDAPVADMKLVAEKAMPKLGGYVPQKLTLSSHESPTVKKKPAMEAPLFGTLKFGGKSYPIALDEPANKDAKLYVDANGNGDLTDDPATVWTKKTANGPNGKQLVQYSGSFKLPLPTGDEPTLVSLGAYRFDKNDPQRAALKNVLLYYSDYAYEGKITIGDATYRAMLANDAADGDFRGKGELAPGIASARILMDLNDDGKFDLKSETFGTSKPFNIKGTTWQLADLTPGGTFKIQKSDKQVAEIPLPANIGKGQAALAFKAQKMDGKPVNFPADYKGKIVLLDFWATWCGPCMAEVPEIVRTYNEYHAKGLEILGISLDQPDSAAQVKKVTGEQKMTWPQVYDGKFWEARVAKMYGIDSIPHAYLVDGDTGKIIAEGNSIRGEGLAREVKKALENKAKAVQ